MPRNSPIRVQIKGGPSPMSHLQCSFKNLLFAAPPRCCLYSYLLTTHGVWPSNVAPRLYEVIETKVSPREVNCFTRKTRERGQVMGLDLLFYPYLRKINFKEFFPIIRQIRFLSGLHMENFRFLSIFSHDTEMFYFEQKSG